jgi:hypothetical protein
MPISPEEIALKHAIDEIYTQHPFYGSRRIAAHLHKYHQITVARETVQRCMREMGISGIGPGPNLSKRNAEHKVYPYLLRHVTASYPNHVWGIDITYIRLRAGWLYLVAVLDCPDDVLRPEGRVPAEEHAGSRALVGHRVDHRHLPLVELDAEVALDPGERVLLADGEHPQQFCAIATIMH